MTVAEFMYNGGLSKILLGVCFALIAVVWQVQKSRDADQDARVKEIEDRQRGGLSGLEVLKRDVASLQETAKGTALEQGRRTERILSLEKDRDRLLQDRDRNDKEHVDMSLRISEMKSAIGVVQAIQQPPARRPDATK